MNLFIFTAILSFTLNVYAQGANFELYRGIEDCNEGAITQALEHGADIEASYLDTIPSGMRPQYYIETNFTPLAYVLVQYCQKAYDQSGKSQSQNEFLKMKIKKMTSLLVERGAQKDIRIVQQFSFYKADLPILMIPYHVDNNDSAMELVEHLVSLGADPSIKDGDGMNLFAHLNLMGRPLSEYHKALDLGVGKIHPSIFPPNNYKIEELKSLLLRIKTEDTLDDATFYTEWASHPVVKTYSNFNSSYNSLNKDQKAKMLDELDQVILPFIGKEKLNKAVGDSKLSFIALAMASVCPVIKEENNYQIDFSFGEDINYAKLQERILVYNHFKKLINGNLVNLNHTDKNGINLLSYAMHLCPSEIAISLIQKGLKPQSLALNYELIQKALKGFYKYNSRKAQFFNNDLRNLELFENMAVASDTDLEEKINEYGSNLLKDRNKKEQWGKLSDLNLFYGDSTRIKVNVDYQLNVLDEIEVLEKKLTEIDGKSSFLESLGQKLKITPYWQTYNFPYGVKSFLISSDKKSSTLRGLNVDLNTTEVKVRLDGKVVYYSIVKNTNTFTGQVELDKVSSEGASLKIEYFKSDRSHKEIITKERDLSLNNIYQGNIPRLNLNELNYNIAIKDQIPVGISGCGNEICKSLRVTENSFSLAIDKLPDEYQQLLKILLASGEEKERLIKVAFDQKSIQVMRYFLDIIHLNPANVEEANVSEHILKNLFYYIADNSEIKTSSYVTILSMYEPINSTGKFLRMLLLFLTTGQSKDEVIQAMKQNTSFNNDFVMVSRSATLRGLSKMNYMSIEKEMRKGK